MPRRIGPSTLSFNRPRDAGPARFDPARKIKLSVREASDVTPLPGGRFLVVGDRSDKAALVGADGQARKIELPNLGRGQSQLEGVAYDPERHHLFVSREESRELLRYEWNPDKKDKPKLEQRFELPLGGPGNKGVEGLAFLSADLSPTGKAHLLAVKEGKPRMLVMLGNGGGGELLKVKLEDQVKSVCKDFSAVAVDPRTGNIFISSDESSTIAQVKLLRDGDKVIGRMVQAFPVRDRAGKALERIEGLAFNARGDLFVLTENEGDLHHFARR